MKVHIIGGFGAGKTTLAQAIAASTGIDAVEFDAIVYRDNDEIPQVELAPLLEAVRSRSNWITEGAQHDAWLLSYLEDASAIVWLDMPLRVYAWRILRRHVSGTVLHQRPWTQTLHLANYVRMTHTSYRAKTQELLAPYAAKTRRCRTAAEVEAVRAELVREGVVSA